MANSSESCLSWQQDGPVLRSDSKGWGERPSTGDKWGPVHQHAIAPSLGYKSPEGVPERLQRDPTELNPSSPQSSLLIQSPRGLLLPPATLAAPRSGHHPQRQLASCPRRLLAPPVLQPGREPLDAHSLGCTPVWGSLPFLPHTDMAAGRATSLYCYDSLYHRDLSFPAFYFTDIGGVSSKLPRGENKSV